MSSRNAAGTLLTIARPITGAGTDYDPLLRLVGDAPLVLLGAATHGSHELHRERARITRRLIHELGFHAVAIEGDWPDAVRVHRFVRAESDDATAEAALRDFRHFPQWMWRNADVRDFVAWLREYNDALPVHAPKVGFYGLDLYSLHASIATMIRCLDRVDAHAAERARQRYACFDHFSGNEEDSLAVAVGLASCERELLEQLVALVPRDVVFCRTPLAEAYYRAMFEEPARMWNLRDSHMAETLRSLQEHLAMPGRDAKIVVWTHNSHAGIARATEMGESGHLNVGELVRDTYGEDAVSIGFTTYDGTVTAASQWDAPVERKRLRPAHPDSCEALFHDTGCPAFFLSLRDPAAMALLDEPRLERAVGVIYRPDTERASHYVYARLAHQFDAIVHVDRTRAVEPLEKSVEWIHAEISETHPTGI